MERDELKFKTIKTYVNEKLNPRHREVIETQFRQIWDSDVVRKTSPDIWVLAVVGFLGSEDGAELRGLVGEYLK